MKSFFWAVSFVLLLIGSQRAEGGLIAYESFDYAPAVQLNGQSGGFGFRFDDGSV